LAYGQKREFLKKNTETQVALLLKLLCFCTGYGPGRSVKRRSKSSRLHSKKVFWLGDVNFLWVTS